MFLPDFSFIPKYRATVRNLGIHAAVAGKHAAEAAKPGDPSKRLTSVAHSLDAFDHVVTDTNRLPFTGGYRKYYAGYSAAKAALGLLLASNALPAARERVGQAEMVDGRNHFRLGVTQYSANPGSSVDRFSSVDLVNHSLEDAAGGVVLLRRPQLARELLGGLMLTRTAIESRKPLNESVVKRVDQLFGTALDLYSQTIAQIDKDAAEAPAQPRPGDPADDPRAPGTGKASPPRVAV